MMKRFILAVAALAVFGIVGCGLFDREWVELDEMVMPTLMEADEPTPVELEEPTLVEEAEEYGELIFATSFDEGYDGVEALGAVIERASVYMRSGDYAMMVAARSETWHGMALDVTDLAAPGGSYMYSLWVKNPGHWRTGFQLAIIIDGETSIMYGEYAAITLNPGQWTRLVGFFEMPTGGETVKLAVQTREDAHQVFFVDDLSLYAIPR